MNKKDQKFIIIIGPPASGKMTVGNQLAEMTGLKLFHNHLSIEAILPVFDFGTKQFGRLVYDFRTRMFEEIAHSDIKGVIFTFVWAFNEESEQKAMDHWSTIFKDVGAHVYMVELQAGIEVRKQRNKEETRRMAKSSKKDIIKSERILLDNERDWEMTAPKDFSFGDGFISIDNTNLTPFEAAIKIKNEFNL